MTAAGGDSWEKPQNQGVPPTPDPPPAYGGPAGYGPSYPAYGVPATPPYEPAQPDFGPPMFGQQPVAPPGGYGPYLPPPPGYPPTPQFPPYDYRAGYPNALPGTNTLAILSLVASVVSLFCVPSSVVGIIVGAVAIYQIKRTRQDGYGLAVAGIVVGVASLVLYLVLLLLANTRGYR